MVVDFPFQPYYASSESVSKRSRDPCWAVE